MELEGGGYTKVREKNDVEAKGGMGFPCPPNSLLQAVQCSKLHFHCQVYVAQKVQLKSRVEVQVKSRVDEQVEDPGESWGEDSSLQLETLPSSLT